MRGPICAARWVSLAATLPLIVLAAGCGGSSGSKTGTSTSTSSTITSATTASSSAAPGSTTTTSATHAATGLSGTWSGHYSGAYSGTFRLTWRQTGSALTGSIALSTPSQTLSVKGTLHGSTIRFGTVGSAAITYTGTASGNSMSGTYQVGGSAGGSWSASRSS